VLGFPRASTKRAFCLQVTSRDARSKRKKRNEEEVVRSRRTSPPATKQRVSENVLNRNKTPSDTQVLKWRRWLDKKALFWSTLFDSFIGHRISNRSTVWGWCSRGIPWHHTNGWIRCDSFKEVAWMQRAFFEGKQSEPQAKVRRRQCTYISSSITAMKERKAIMYNFWLSTGLWIIS